MAGRSNLEIAARARRRARNDGVGVYGEERLYLHHD